MELSSPYVDSSVYNYICAWTDTTKGKSGNKDMKMNKMLNRGLTPQTQPEGVTLSLTSSHDRQSAVGQDAW